ncbi:MAG: LptF/LptG family permease [Candidatus Omnitrophota bacterium]|nr:LptF/LptG family permease [Candidatus Omnitrophota bacterium]
MKVIDRYLVRELLMPIVCSSATLVFMILIADLFDNLDEILRNRISIGIILKYYFSLIPYAYCETIPWATWLGTLFLLVNFGLHNEIIAMKVAGLRITTIIKPIVFVGFLIGIFTFLIGDRLVPVSYRMATDLREVYIEQKKERKEEKSFQNVTYYSGGNQLFYFRTFYATRKVVEDAIILWMDKPDQTTFQKTIAERGKWSGTAWEFEGVTEYKVDSQGRILGEPRYMTKKVYPQITMTPRELLNASSDSAFLSYRELKHSIAKLKENGVLVYSEKVDLQYKLASPWQGLVMMLIAVPLLAPTRNRKAIAGTVLLCVGLVFSYHVMGAVGLALGKAGKLIPFAGAWLGNIVFSVGALLNLDRGNR